MSMYYKLFLHKKRLNLVKYDVSNDYLNFIDKNREKGYFQLIINSRLIITLAERYIEKQFIVNKIDVSENTLLDISDIKLSNIKNNTDLKKLKTELFNFKDDYFIEINSMSISDINYENDIIIRSNGVIEFKGLNIEKNCNLLLEILEDIL